MGRILMNKVKLWFKAIRAPFFLGTIMAGLLGSALAYSDGKFNWLYLLISIVIIAGTNSGINLINDYFDYKSRNDEINKYPTPFSGGSRVIQDKLIKPKQMLIGGIVSFTIVAIIGLIFVIFVNFNLIWFGLAGIILGYFYTATPLKIGYRGFGEVTVFLMSGPLAVCGTYFLFTGSINLKSILLSIPQGLLVFVILFINEFPDYAADKAVNKNHLVVRLGRAKARYVYSAVIALVYLSVILPVAFRILPVYLLIFLITLPIALKAVFITLKKFDIEKEIIPAQANTIILTIACGLLLSLGFVIDKLLI
jgi:1,4-dihydroxy-2-naphthoate polyprenyltransferase